MTIRMTSAQSSALTWLAAHNGDGCFDNDGVLLAAGERAPHMRATWNGLERLGLVETYRLDGRTSGRPRLTITPKGRRFATR